MSQEMTHDEEGEPMIEDDFLDDEEEAPTEKLTKGKTAGRGLGKRRGRGGALTKGRNKKTPKTPEISEDDIEEEIEHPLPADSNVDKKSSFNETDKVQKNMAKKSTTGRKSPRVSLLNDTQKFGQPPGGGNRTSTRRRSALQSTFEEPPDSPILDEDDESSPEEEATNNVSSKSKPAEQGNAEEKEGTSPLSAVESDDFLGFSNIPEALPIEETSLQDTPFEGKDDGSDAGSESEEKATDERDPVKKRGRGRPPMQWRRGRRRKSPVNTQLPPEATSDVPDYLKEELQHAFEIYLALRSTSKIGPFLYRPSANMFGMSSYYNVIKSPMWLDEVKRKLMCHGYSCISQFIFDIRLMLENCFKYWGQDHKFSKIALQIESKLEQKIETLPMAIRDKCKDSSVDGLENADFLKMEPDDFRGYAEDASEVLKNKCNKNLSSKILTKLSLSSKTIDGPTPLLDKSREEEVLAWERLHLVTPNVKDEIRSSWELAAIGLFLNTAQEYLNLSKIRQYEIERMLLMPKESTTLATIMTTLLSPSAVRCKLDATIPIMSYEVWNKKLRKKVEDWFGVYYNKNGSESEVFMSCGVEPHFWRSMSYVNHYEDKDFSEITYHQRCSIFKALCDNLCCTTKSIQDSLQSDSSDSFLSLEEIVLGELKDCVYFYLPFWPDIRVYKMRTVSSKQMNSSKNISVLTNKILRSIVSPDSECQTNDVNRSELFEEFSLVADSAEDMLVLIDEVKCLNSSLSSKLTSLNQKMEEQLSPYVHVLSQIYNQWTGYNDRKSTFDTESLSYWDSNEDVSSDKGYFDVEDPVVLGKRTRTIKKFATSLTSSDEDEDIFDRDDDGSDWECPSEKKKMLKKEKALKDTGDGVGDIFDNRAKKKKLPKTPRVKKNKTDQQEKKSKLQKKASTPVKDSGNLSSSVVIKNVLSLSTNANSKHFNSNPVHEEITIKTEPPIYPVKMEFDDNNMLETKIKEEPREDEKEEPAKEVKKEIKQEREVISDVISLSSQDEDDDDDVIITTPVKQMPQPVAVTTPVSNVVRPPVNNLNLNQSPLRNPSPVVRSPLIPSPRITSPVTPPINNPRLNFTPSPRISSPRQVTPRMPGTPRQRFSSPMQPTFTPPKIGPMVTPPRQRTMSPRVFPPVQSRPPPTPPQVSRNLFNNIRPNQAPPTNPNAKGIKAKLTFGKRDDGSYGYLARLPDGGVINMSPQQIDSIRKKNGSIPSVISIPFA